MAIIDKHVIIATANVETFMPQAAAGSEVDIQCGVSKWQVEVDEVAQAVSQLQLVEFKRRVCVAGAQLLIDEVGVAHQRAPRRLSLPLSSSRVSGLIISNPIDVEDSDSISGHFDYVVGTRRTIEGFSLLSKGQVTDSVVFIRNQSMARGSKRAYHTNWEWTANGLAYATHPNQLIKSEVQESPDFYSDSLNRFAGLLDRLAQSAGITLPEPEALAGC